MDALRATLNLIGSKGLGVGDRSRFQIPVHTDIAAAPDELLSFI